MSDPFEVTDEDAIVIVDEPGDAGGVSFDDSDPGQAGAHVHDSGGKGGFNPGNDAGAFRVSDDEADAALDELGIDEDFGTIEGDTAALVSVDVPEFDGSAVGGVSGGGVDAAFAVGGGDFGLGAYAYTDNTTTFDSGLGSYGFSIGGTDTTWLGGDGGGYTWGTGGADYGLGGNDWSTTGGMDSQLSGFIGAYDNNWFWPITEVGSQLQEQANNELTQMLYETADDPYAWGAVWGTYQNYDNYSLNNTVFDPGFDSLRDQVSWDEYDATYNGGWNTVDPFYYAYDDYDYTSYDGGGIGFDYGTQLSDNSLIMGYGQSTWDDTSWSDDYVYADDFGAMFDAYSSWDDSWSGFDYGTELNDNSLIMGYGQPDTSGYDDWYTDDWYTDNSAGYFADYLADTFSSYGHGGIWDDSWGGYDYGTELTDNSLIMGYGQPGTSGYDSFQDSYSSIWDDSWSGYDYGTQYSDPSLVMGYGQPGTSGYDYGTQYSDPSLVMGFGQPGTSGYDYGTQYSDPSLVMGYGQPGTSGYDYGTQYSDPSLVMGYGQPGTSGYDYGWGTSVGGSWGDGYGNDYVPDDYISLDLNYGSNYNYGSGYGTIDLGMGSNYNYGSGYGTIDLGMGSNYNYGSGYGTIDLGMGSNYNYGSGYGTIDLGMGSNYNYGSGYGTIDLGMGSNYNYGSGYGTIDLGMGSNYNYGSGYGTIDLGMGSNYNYGSGYGTIDLGMGSNYVYADPYNLGANITTMIGNVGSHQNDLERQWAEYLQGGLQMTNDPVADNANWSTYFTGVHLMNYSR